MNKMLQEIAGASLGAVTCDDAGSFQARYLFPEGFCGFDGHFPGHPILPAIVELLTVVSLAGEQAGYKQRLVAVEEAKFLIPVRPGQEILVSCRPRTVKGKLLLDARLTVAGKTSASLLIELAGAKDES
jgi:3-hydroxyacyl-[acyl-carrier-protein] dehydratase